jgi:hypothetical protein
MLTKLFETAQNSADQRNSHSILHLHVALRSVQVLSLASTVVGGLIFMYRRSGKLSNLILKANATSLVAGMVAGPFMVERVMNGKEEIEWQDRAWRLLHHAKQNKVDDGAIIGAMGLGMACALVRKPGVAIIGGAGLGMLGGGLLGIILNENLKL